MSIFDKLEIGDEITITRPNLPTVTDVIVYVSEKRLVTEQGYRLYFESDAIIEKTGRNFSASKLGLTPSSHGTFLSPSTFALVELARSDDALAFSAPSLNVE